MAKKVKLCPLSEAPAIDSVCEMSLGERKLCLANIGGKLYAMDNDCPHRMGPLGEGIVEDGAVLCPWHGWGFDPATGLCRDVPGTGVRTYPTEVAGEFLLVEIDGAV
jgi:nitrite reductase (NADH) small subunit